MKLEEARTRVDMTTGILEMKTAMAAHLSSTTVRFEKDPARMISEASEFLAALPHKIIKQKPLSIKVQVNHPDGISCVIKMKCYNVSVLGSVLEWQRYGGDCLVYHLTWRMFEAFLENQTLPSFSEGDPFPLVWAGEGRWEGPGRISHVA